MKHDKQIGTYRDMVYDHRVPQSTVVRICHHCMTNIEVGEPCICYAGTTAKEFDMAHVHEDCHAAGHNFAMYNGTWGETFFWLHEVHDRMLIARSAAAIGDMRWLKTHVPAAFERVGGDVLFARAALEGWLD